MGLAGRKYHSNGRTEDALIRILREAALQFAAWGASIVLACRNPPPSSREPRPESVVDECVAKARVSSHLKSSFEFWQVDLADLASVEAFTERWLETKRPLDILCNNAGLGSSPGGKKVFRTKDGFEIIHQVRRVYSNSPLSAPHPSAPRTLRAANDDVPCSETSFRQDKVQQRSCEVPWLMQSPRSISSPTCLSRCGSFPPSQRPLNPESSSQPPASTTQGTST